MYIVNNDSALVLQELLDQPISELLSSCDESASRELTPSPSPMSMSAPPLKTKRKSPVALVTISSNTSDGILHEDNETKTEMELSPDIVTDDEIKDEEMDTFHFPISRGNIRPRSSSCSDAKSDTLRRADTAPLFDSDAQGTDYWISLVIYLTLLQIPYSNYIN